MPQQAWRVETRLVALAFLVMGPSLVAYGGRQWMPALASRHGAGVDAMLQYLFFTTGTLVLIGFGALAWLVWTGARRGAPRRLPVARTESVLALSIGVLMALIAEGGVLAIGLPVWQEYFQPEESPVAVTVEVTGQQFLWNVRYAGEDGKFGRKDLRLIDDVSNPLGLDKSDPAAADDIVLVNRIVAEADRPLRVRLHSKDMIHSFFLPHLRVKQDVIPGMTPDITFVPTREGSFELLCAELCGLGHYRMQGVLRVVRRGHLDRALREEAQ
jgi:cytochrome c oxidase subunit 2